MCSLSSDITSPVMVSKYKKNLYQLYPHFKLGIYTCFIHQSSLGRQQGINVGYREHLQITVNSFHSVSIVRCLMLDVRCLLVFFNKTRGESEKSASLNYLYTLRAFSLSPLKKMYLMNVLSSGHLSVRPSNNFVTEMEKKQHFCVL